MKSRLFLFKSAFTIVELLVVIVIIGVLASVVIVSYSNVSSRSTVASLQNDLTNAKKQLLNFQTQSSTGKFPISISTCPVTDSSTQMCIKPSGTNQWDVYTELNNGTASSFYLSIRDSNSSNYYSITDSSNANLRSSIINTNLILHLDAGNSSSYQSPNTTWNDISGNGLVGTLLNGPSYDSSNGGSLLFNGTNNYVTLNSIPAINNLTRSFTVEAIIKFNTSGGQYGIFSKGGSVWSSWAVYLRQGPQFAFLGQATDSTNTTVIATPSGQISVNTWYHLVFIYDGVSLNGYINGVSKAQLLNWNRIFTTTGSSNYIGYDSGVSSPNYFPGNISIVRLYNRALSQSEIYQNFYSQKDRFGI